MLSVTDNARRKAIADALQPGRAPKDLKTVEKAGNPNAEAFKPAEIKDPDCNNLHVLPGTLVERQHACLCCA